MMEIADVKYYNKIWDEYQKIFNSKKLTIEYCAEFMNSRYLVRKIQTDWSIRNYDIIFSERNLEIFLEKCKIYLKAKGWLK